MNPDLPLKDIDLSVEDFFSHICQAVRCACHCYHHPSDSDTVDEISQEIFFKLIRNDFRLLRSFDSRKGKLAPWLTVIAKHVVVRYFHASRRLQSLEGIDADSLAFSSPQEETLFLKECLALLPTLAEKLSPRERQMVDLLLQVDLNDTERVKSMGLKPSSFRTLKCGTRKKLREMLTS